MYQLVKAFARATTAGARWTEIDLGTMVLGTAYTAFDECYAVLTNPFYPTERCLDLADIKSEYATSTLTFNDMLGGIADQSLPTSDQIPVIQTYFAKYANAMACGYKVIPISPNAHPDAPIPMADRLWLSLTRDNTDYHDFYDNCLVTINGFIHRIDTNGDRVYVIDGMKSNRYSGENHIGIINFKKLGGLECLSIQESMIHRRYADMPLGKTMYIDIGTAKPGKTPMLVLGGYLHVLDTKTFYQVSDTIFAIDFANFPWPKRFYESGEYFDFSFLELESLPYRDSQVSTEELFSDRVLKLYATMSQSFFAFVNTPDLFVERDPLPPTRIVGDYISHIEPKHPLITGVGRLTDYWSEEENGRWSVHVADGTLDYRTFTTTPFEGLVSIDDSRIPEKQVVCSPAHYLMIGTDIKTTGA